MLFVEDYDLLEFVTMNWTRASNFFLSPSLSLSSEEQNL